MEAFLFIALLVFAVWVLHQVYPHGIAPDHRKSPDEDNYL